MRSALAFAIHKFFQEKASTTSIRRLSPKATARVPAQCSKCDHPASRKASRVPKMAPWITARTSSASPRLHRERPARRRARSHGSRSDIHFLGPTFRAENSNTPRHLSEFWMIEPEMAFYDIADNMDLAEEFVKYCIGYAPRPLPRRYRLPRRAFRQGACEPSGVRAHNDFVRLTYTEGVEILKASGRKFEFPSTGAPTSRANTSATSWKSISASR